MCICLHFPLTFLSVPAYVSASHVCLHLPPVFLKEVTFPMAATMLRHLNLWRCTDCANVIKVKQSHLTFDVMSKLMVLLASPTNTGCANNFAKLRGKQQDNFSLFLEKETDIFPAAQSYAQVSKRRKGLLIWNHLYMSTVLCWWYKEECWSFFCAMSWAETVLSYLETLYDCLQINWYWQSITKSCYPTYLLVGNKIEHNEKIFGPKTSAARHQKWMSINL